MKLRLAICFFLFCTLSSSVYAQTFQKLILEDKRYHSISINRSVYNPKDQTIWNVGNIGWEKAVLFQTNQEGEVLRGHHFSMPATTELLIDFMDIFFFDNNDIGIAGNIHKGDGSTPFLMRFTEQLQFIYFTEYGPYLLYGGYSYWNPRVAQGPSGNTFMLHGLYSNGKFTAHLLKINGDGELLWNIKLGENKKRQPLWCIERVEDGLLIGGEHLLKVDFDGNILWGTTFADAEISSIKATADKRTFLTGFYQDDKATECVLLAEVKEQEILWARKYDSLPRRPKYYEQSLNLLHTNSDELVFSYVVTPERKNKIVKVDLQGFPLWGAQVKAGNGFVGNRLSSMIETANHHYLISLWEGRFYQLNEEGDSDVCWPVSFCPKNEKINLQKTPYDFSFVTIPSEFRRSGQLRGSALALAMADTCGGDQILSPLGEPGISAFFFADSSYCIGAEVLVQEGFVPFEIENEYWETNAFGDTISRSSEPFEWLLTEPGSYWLRRTIRVFGCLYEYEWNFEAIPSPVISLGEDISVCGPDTIALELSTDQILTSTYWNTGATSPGITVTESGNYSVLTTNALGCSEVDTIAVEITLPPLVDLGRDTVVCETGYELLPAFEGELLWEDGTTELGRLISESGTFIASASNDCGSMTDTIKVEISNCDPAIYIPNVFSPNNDGINDELLITTNLAELVQTRIFSRWGEYVFESTKPTELWNGTFNGEPCEVGVYLYVVTYLNLKTGREEQLAGDITLVR